jgi:hypothetical protein
LIEQGKFPLAQIPGYIGNVINYGRGRDFDGTHATAGELLAAGANNPVTRVAGAGLIILTLPVSGPISVGTAIVVGSGTAIAASEAASVGYELATGREHPGVIAGGLNLAGVDPNTSRYVVMAIEGVQIAIDIAMLRPKRLKIGSIDQTRADQLARDSATSRLRPGEGNVGAGMEGRYGPLERIPPGTAKPPDFRFTAGLNQGRTVDVVMADMPGSRFQSEWGNIKKIITGHLGKADVVPIDLRHISQSERQMVEGFVGSLSPHDQAKILFVE